MKLNNPFTSDNPLIICCSVWVSIGLATLLLILAIKTFGVFSILFALYITALIPVLVYIFKGD